VASSFADELLKDRTTAGGHEEPDIDGSDTATIRDFIRSQDPRRGLASTTGIAIVRTSGWRPSAPTHGYRSRNHDRE
jgi:hypothetical protein